jgi:hypothetical protein
MRYSALRTHQPLVKLKIRRRRAGLRAIWHAATKEAVIPVVSTAVIAAFLEQFAVESLERGQPATAAMYGTLLVALFGGVGKAVSKIAQRNRQRTNPFQYAYLITRFSDRMVSHDNKTWFELPGRQGKKRAPLNPKPTLSK